MRFDNKNVMHSSVDATRVIRKTWQPNVIPNNNINNNNNNTNNNN